VRSWVQSLALQKRKQKERRKERGKERKKSKQSEGPNSLKSLNVAHSLNMEKYFHFIPIVREI
jgi:hypothetical protein